MFFFIYFLISNLHLKIFSQCLRIFCFNSVQNFHKIDSKFSVFFKCFVFDSGGLSRGPAHFHPVWASFCQPIKAHFGPNLAHEISPTQLWPGIRSPSGHRAKMGRKIFYKLISKTKMYFINVF